MILLSIVDIKEYDQTNINEASLSSDRRLKISRIKHEKSRKLSICAEIALIRAIREFTHEEVSLPLEIEEEEGSRGKPVFARESPYCGKLFFSLSHAGNLAAAAVSDHDLGMDIEVTDRNIPKSADKILSPDLYRNFCKLEKEKQDDFFFETWTALESFMKLTGQGVYLDPRKTEISPERQISSTDSCETGFVHSCSRLLESEGISGYKCSVCSSNREELFSLLFLSPLFPVFGS